MPELDTKTLLWLLIAAAILQTFCYILWIIQNEKLIKALEANRIVIKFFVNMIERLTGEEVFTDAKTKDDARQTVKKVRARG